MKRCDDHYRNFMLVKPGDTQRLSSALAFSVTRAQSRRIEIAECVLFGRNIRGADFAVNLTAAKQKESFRLVLLGKSKEILSALKVCRHCTDRIKSELLRAGGTRSVNHIVNFEVSEDRFADVLDNKLQIVPSVV